MRRWFVVLLLLLPAPWWPGAAAGEGGAARFERFLRESGPPCVRQPAGRCLARFFAYLDTDRDRRVAPAELRRARADAGAWLVRHGDRLPPLERNLADGLLWTVDLVGVDRLFASYDEDGDGGLTAAELFADLRTDHRPLGELLRDPAAFDWPRLRRRFGRAALLLEAVLGGLR